MKDIVNRYIDRFQKNHRHFRRYIIFVGVLAIVTIIGVNWGLHQEGISMTDEYVCGYQEHQHTDDCYQNELICGQEENDEHQHSEECYEKTLICTLPEHTHTDSCKKQVGVSTIAVYTSNSMNANGNVTAISGNGTKYDENGNIYSLDLRIDFKFSAAAVSSNQSYYYEYPEGIIIPDALLNKTYTLYDSQGKEAGTYSFEKTEDGKYRVKIDFKEGYVTIENDDITGYIEFAGQIDASKADDNGNIKIVGSDKVDLVIPKDQITYPEDATNRYDIKTEKAGSYSTKDGKLVYTVYVYSLKGTPEDIKFEDIINADGLTLGTPVVKITQETVTRYYNNGGSYDGSTTKDSKTLDVPYDYSDKKLTMTLPKIEKAKDYTDSSNITCKDYTRYKIEYTYDIKDIEGASVVANNKVTTDSKKENVEVKSDDTVQIKINNVHTINKSGWYDSNNGEIVWTITVNENNLDITGAKLTDDMLSKLAEGTDVTISPSNNGYNLEKDENGKITGITFTALDDGKNTNTYTITYRTKADRKWDKATFKPSTGDGITSKGTVDVPGGGVNKKYTEAKESKDDKTAEVGWKITVDVPSSLPKDTVIKDDPTQDQYGGSGGKQYLTHQQVIEWANGIYWTDGDGNKVGDNLDLTKLADISFKASDGHEYTWEQINSSDSNDLTFTVWNVKLKNDLDVPKGAQKLIFDYKTTADLEDADMGTTYYNNTVTIGDKKVDARYGYEKSGVIKTDENGRKETTTKTNADGTLVWKIKTHINKETSKLTFEDNLPEGIELVSIAGRDYLNNLTNIIIQDDGTINGTDGYYQASGKYEDNKLTLDVAPSSTGNKLSNGDYTIVLTCKVNKDNINNYESGKTYTFKNSATVSNDEGNIGSADQSQKWTEDTSHEESKVIDKTGKWDNNSRRVKYSISLNPDGKDIVEDSEILTLKDVFRYFTDFYGQQDDGDGTTVKYHINARLITDSVKLYQGIKKEDGTLEKGEEIKSWAWTVEESRADYEIDGGYLKYSTLVGKNLPDSTPMILEYDYQLETDMPNNWHSQNKLDVHNSAELLGTTYKDDKDQNDVVWKKQESSGAVTTDIKGILYKVSQGNYGKTLPGAIFKLQKYNNEQFEDTDITYTTDRDGKITIMYQKEDSDIQYDHNVLYRVIETSAPKDYIISDNPEENAFYFYFSSDTDTIYKLPENLNELAPKAADLSKSSTTFYVENESCNTELTINKKWFDAQGNVEVGHSGTVRVQLYQRTSKYPPSMGNIAKISGSIDVGMVGNTKEKQFTEGNYRIGSVVKFTVTYTGDSEANTPLAPTVKLNGEEIIPEKTTPWDGNKVIYTYTFTLNKVENIITGNTHSWNLSTNMMISDLDVTEPETDTFYGAYDITSSDNWSKVISDLPAISINDAGERVYYTYYVKELGNSNYDVSYDNNEGINFGTITIKNKMSENPSYVLPETGSFGEVIVALGGLIMMIVAVIYYLKNKKIEGKGRKI